MDIEQEGDIEERRLLSEDEVNDQRRYTLKILEVKERERGMESDLFVMPVAYKG